MFVIEIVHSKLSHRTLQCKNQGMKSREQMIISVICQQLLQKCQITPFIMFAIAQDIK